MGSKLAKSPSDNTNNLKNETQPSHANTSQNTQTSAHHPHVNLNSANIPAGCPMHQAKADQQTTTNDHTKNLVKTASGSGCPIGNNNDINPNNMV
jgi:hypothetical protein